MKPQRTASRLLLFLLLAVCLLAPGQAAWAASRVNRGVPLTGERTIAALDAALPSEADSLADFAPAGTTPQSVNSNSNHTLNGETQLLTFAADTVGLLIEADSGANHAQVTFALQQQQMWSATESSKEQTLSTFSLNLIDARGRATQLRREMRLVVDLRELTNGQTSANGTFFLSQRSAADPTRWVDVPLTLHSPDGLLSATVNSGGDWQAGFTPERWSPSFNEPGVSAYTGAATYNYPISVPSGRNGLQPNVALSYSSRGLDGRIYSSSTPAVADGWSLAEIRVVREDARLGLNSANQASFILPDTYRLVLNGAGHELEAGGTGQYGGTRFYAEGAPGLYVERHAVTTNPERERFYWTVITADGVRYRLGYDDSAEEFHATPHAAHLVMDGAADDQFRIAGIAWNVDLVVDTFGNAMTYAYLTREIDEEFLVFSEWQPVNVIFTTVKTRIHAIAYNYPTTVAQVQAAWPLVGEPAGSPAAQVLFRATAGENLNAGTFSDQQPLNRIYIFTGGAINPEAEYRIEVVAERTLSQGCDVTNIKTWTIASIQQVAGTDPYSMSDDTPLSALPATTFSYTPLHHFDDNHGPCYSYSYLTGIDNGYGGTVTYSYASDGRSVGDYGYYYNEDGDHVLGVPKMGYSYVVDNLQVSDGQNPTTTTSYSYAGPCYGQWAVIDTNAFADARACDSEAQEHGSLLGFDSVTMRQLGYVGEQLSRVDTTFGQADVAHQYDQQMRGRPLSTQMFDGADDLVGTTVNTYVSLGFANSLTFHYVQHVANTTLDPQTGNSRTQSQAYEYASALQGNAFYGNQTVTFDYGVDGATDDKTLVQCFVPNQAAWIVNKVALERVFGGILPQIDGSLCAAELNHPDLLRETRTVYDDGAGVGIGGSNSSTPDYLRPPVRGAISQQFAGLPGAPVDGSDNGMLIGALTQYDTFGNPIQIEATSGVVTSIAYDTTYQLFPEQVTITGPDVITQQMQYEFYGAAGVASMSNGAQMPFGALYRSVDANNLATVYEYDPFGRLFAVYESESDRGNTSQKWDGNPVVRYRYWDNAWNASTLLSPFRIDEDARPNLFTTDGSATYSDLTYYDGLGRPIQTRSRFTDVGTTTRDIIALTDYNARGQVDCSSLPFAVNSNSPYVTTACDTVDHSTTQFDTLGRPVAEISPAGTTVRHAYSLGSNGLSYHDVIDPNGHRIRSGNDAAGQLISVEEFDGSCGAFGISCQAGETAWSVYALTKYSYALTGELVQVTDNVGNETLISYDALGRKTVLDDPDMGIWQYGYDAQGNLAHQTDALGQTICFAYDSHNRLTQKWQAANTACATVAEGSPNWLSSYTYDVQLNNQLALGMPTVVRWAPDGTVNFEHFTYDDKLRLGSHTRVIDGVGYSMSVGGYDGLNRPVSVQQPNGAALTYTYNRRGEASVYADDMLLVDNVQFNAIGQLTHVAFGNDTTTRYGYNGPSGDLRLNHIEVKHGSDHLFRLNYDYDASGNITAIDEVAPATCQFVCFGGSWDVVDAQRFGYDAQNRLTSASGSHPADAYDIGYSYDTIGNITQVTGMSAGATVNYAYNGAQAHAVTQVGTDTFNYDANGNMIYRVMDGQHYSHAFDVANRMVSVTAHGLMTDEITFFAYDAGELRTKTVEPDGKVTHFPSHMSLWRTQVGLTN